MLYFYLPSGVLLERLFDRDEVLETFGHLEALDVQVTRVQEVVHPLSAVVPRLSLASQKLTAIRF